MPDLRRRRIATIIVVATALLAVGVLVWFAWPTNHYAHIEPLFLEDTEVPQWPPEAPADLEAELASTSAARRIGAAGLLTEFDAGPTRSGDMPGLQVRAGVSQELYYIEAVLGDAEFDDTMPMAVLIHGRGDRARIPGGPFWGLGAPIRVIVPQAPDPLGQGFEWVPVRVGQNLLDRLTTALLSRAAQIASMLRELMQTRPTVGRVMVVGFSQGGLLTFTLATHHTDVVHAAFPLSAWLPPALVPPYLRDDIRQPRIRGMHGDDDHIIEPRPTLELYETLRERGFDAEIVTFEGVGHTMSSDMNAQLHAWLREEMGLVIDQGIRDGLIDAGTPPCVPMGEWPDEPDGGWPEAGWPEAGWPEAGWDASAPDGGWPDSGATGAWPFPWLPCAEPGPDAAVEAGVPDAGAPDASMDAG